jgi:hypothetical protein
LNRTGVDNFSDPNYFKKPAPEDYRYGKSLFYIFGEQIDVEILASERKIIPPYVCFL